jgi:hypothetical protein
VGFAGGVPAVSLVVVSAMSRMLLTGSPRRLPGGYRRNGSTATATKSSDT